MTHMLRTFFQGSATQAILALLDLTSTRLSPQDLEEISLRIERARRPG
jgi:hypothetical protein